jgi:hypothetical protein
MAMALSDARLCNPLISGSIARDMPAMSGMMHRLNMPQHQKRSKRLWARLCGAIERLDNHSYFY